MSKDRAQTKSSPRFKLYPAYKDSGVEWLGGIPAVWGIKRLKRVVRFQGGGTPAKDNVEYWRGDIPWVSPKDMKVSVVVDTEDKITLQAIRESATSLVPAGAVLIVVRSGILAHTIPVALAGCEVTLNQDLKAMIPRSELLPQYLLYLISGKQRELLFEWKKEGATVESLELDLVVRTPIPVPDLDEQRAIVIFLDREIEKIDALVAKKERLIELLQEKSTALITRAVTKGPDPKVRMKDSGVEWLGQIPAHWEIKKLKYVVKGGLVNGLFKKKDQYGTGVKLINVVNLYEKNFHIDFDALEYVEADQEEIKTFLVSSGDIFFVRSSLKLEGIGSAACAAAVTEPVVFECHLVRVRPSQTHISPEYLVYYLNSSLVRQRLIALAETTTMTTIAQPKLASLGIAIPSHSEQRAIVSHLDQETTKFDTLVAKVRDGIDRLREERLALISAAVTGKIDVRGEVS